MSNWKTNLKLGMLCRGCVYRHVYLQLCNTYTCRKLCVFRKYVKTEMNRVQRVEVLAWGISRTV